MKSDSSFSCAPIKGKENAHRKENEHARSPGQEALLRSGRAHIDDQLPGSSFTGHLTLSLLFVVASGRPKAGSMKCAHYSPDHIPLEIMHFLSPFQIIAIICEKEKERKCICQRNASRGPQIPSSSLGFNNRHQHQKSIDGYAKRREERNRVLVK